jgi:hypothetical protein
MGKNQDPDPGSGMKNQDNKTILKLKNNLLVKTLELFDVDPGSGMKKIRIRDGKKSDPG